MTHPFRFQNAALMMALAIAYPLQAHALAGIAQFTAGEVNVRQTDGRTLALAKGGAIDSGQAIVTGSNGRAQVKFTDGGLISLQPNTDFRIASYVDQNDPKEDRFLVDLLRGSMRAITGLIGKRNRDNYKLTTTTATIGIRGSGFKVGYNPDGSLGITSELDKIEVCNQSGCIGMVAGESVRVVDSVTPPIRTSEQPRVETPPAEKEPTVAGDKVDGAGKAAIIAGQTPVPVQRKFIDVMVAAVGTNDNTKYEVRSTSGATTVFSDNKLLKLDNDVAGGSGKWSESGTPQPEVNFKSVGNVSDANFIGWGTWTTGVRDNAGTLMLDHVHYVAGRPTPQADITALMNSGTANYSLVGGTATQNGAVGTLNSAIFQVTFSTGYSISATFNTSFGSFSDTASGSSPAFNGVNNLMQGMFIGANAAYAGVTFAKDPGTGLITGAAAFKKP